MNTKKTKNLTKINDKDYEKLFKEMSKKLEALEKEKSLNALELRNIIKDEGIDDEKFIKWVSQTTANMGLPSIFDPLIAKATELMNRVPIIWIELQDCAGETEAFLRSYAPNIDSLLFDVLSLEFHETLMAAAGNQAEAQLEDARKHFKGKYLLFVEGSIPRGEHVGCGTVGPSGETFEEQLIKLHKDAAVVIAAGSCACFGGIQAAYPNPTSAVGVSEVITHDKLVNVPGCPANPANLLGVVLHYILTGDVPPLDELKRPKFAFEYRVHDNCERRGHFDKGRFVLEWGDEGAQNNWCLLKMGCKGPKTYNNCSIVRFNEGISWDIGSGSPCIACSEPNFWDKYAFLRTKRTKLGNEVKPKIIQSSEGKS